MKNEHLSTIRKLLAQGNCPSKLFLAFKNSSTLDEAKEEEIIIKNSRPVDENYKKDKNMIDSNGWVG